MMRFTPVTNREKLDAATEAILKKLKRPQRFTHTHHIGFRPSSIEAEITWDKKTNVWHAVWKRGDHYWIPFGIGQRDETHALNIAVEINTPRKKNHGRAGLILSDEKGRLYLAHTGRVGGGKPGINRSNFMAYYGMNKQNIVYYGKEKFAILIGGVKDADLVDKIFKFVKTVYRFKEQDPAEARIQPPKQKNRPFQPKFTGKITYAAKSAIEAKLRHDLVASALQKKLAPTACFQSQRRDVYTITRNGEMKVLYEIKTDTTTTSLYTGTGQLMLNGRGEDKPPRLVLVIPGKPAPKTTDVLKKLGIQVLTYRWKGDRPILPDDCLK